MKKEKENDVATRLEQLNDKRINDLEEKNKALVKNGVEMTKEIKHLKLVIAGQKGRLQLMSKEVDKWKKLELEADELNEQRIAKIEELDNALCAKDKTVSGLESQVSELIVKKKQLESAIEAQADVIKELEETVYKLRQPWYKKIFN